MKHSFDNMEKMQEEACLICFIKFLRIKLWQLCRQLESTEDRVFDRGFANDAIAKVTTICPEGKNAYSKASTDVKTNMGAMDNPSLPLRRAWGDSCASCPSRST